MKIRYVLLIISSNLFSLAVRILIMILVVVKPSMDIFCRFLSRALHEKRS